MGKLRKVWLAPSTTDPDKNELLTILGCHQSLQQTFRFMPKCRWPSSELGTGRACLLLASARREAGDLEPQASWETRRRCRARPGRARLPLAGTMPQSSQTTQGAWDTAKKAGSTLPTGRLQGTQKEV